MRRSSIISVFLLVVITFIAFLPCLKNGFLNWDDPAYITENPLIKDLSVHGVRRMFLAIHQKLYKPLTLFSFAIEYRFFGLNPFNYHLDNLLLHIINCLLVFWLINLLSKSVAISFLTALLFGIHPLHVESVAWAVERKDVLYSLFFLSSLITYTYYLKNSSPGRYCLSFFLFILSLLSKPMAVTLPLVLCAVDFLQKRRLNIKCFKEKIPFLIFSFAAIFITMHTYAHSPEAKALSWESPFIVSYGLLFYLKKIFLPFGLSAIYPYPQKIHGLLPGVFYLSLPASIFLAAAVAFSLKYSRKVVFGASFFLIVLLPVIQILPNDLLIAADRYTYLAYIGVFYLLSEGLFWLYQKNPKIGPILSISLTFTIVTLSYLTYNRCKIWKESMILWNDVLKKYPQVSLAYNNRGLVYYDQGKIELSLIDYNKAIQLDPSFANAYYNRGNIYLAQGNLAQALSEYNKALQFSPGYADIYNNRGLTYQKEGNLNQAISDYNKVLEINPDYAEVYGNRGNVYLAQGKPIQAISDYSKAIGLKPNFAEAYNNRAIVYLSQQEYAKSLTDFHKAEKLGYKVNPGLIDAARREKSL